MKAPRIEDATTVRIGKRYNVPLVKWVSRERFSPPSWAPRFVPVLGPLHEDADIIKFEELHWHIDWRFIPERQWKRVWTWRCDRKDYMAAPKVLSVQNTDGVVIRGTRKCLRHHIIYPGRDTTPKVPWIDELEAKYAHAVVKCSICPHRGISLMGAPEKNGARICPAHGLAWNIQTGALQPR